MTMLGRGRRSAKDKAAKDEAGKAAAETEEAAVEAAAEAAEDSAEEAERSAAEAEAAAAEEAERAREAEKAEKAAAAKKAAAAEKAAEKAARAAKAAERARRAAEAAKAAQAAEEAAARAEEAAALAQAAAAAAEAGTDVDTDTDAADADTDVADGTAVEDAGEAEDDAARDADADGAAKPAAPRKRFRRAAKSGAGAEPAETDRETVPAASASGERSWTPYGGVTALAVATVLIIALGAGAVVLGLKWRETKATEEAAKQGTFAASRAAQDLSSYDYRTLDSDFKTAATHTTGKLRTQYDQLAQQLKTTAVEQQAVSTSTIVKTGVVSATPTKVVALVYANRSTSTKSDKTQRLPEALRIKMTMVKVKGKWLASELTVIS
ncbi:hypothetical protein [Actinomadura parmotrematis]|uniref:Mce-associated membrane protein n=1 Tax=Actinomadura parmotrematis TaxID=2864039 RepID=A0ABS7FXK3_9ACTN|nr:hypothetical protein [Actinomadura parmotrematis]MBW8485158.1 hypothetical protein [Actinomadura parmotrematis]